MWRASQKPAREVERWLKFSISMWMRNSKSRPKCRSNWAKSWVRTTTSRRASSNTATTKSIWGWLSPSMRTNWKDYKRPKKAIKRGCRSWKTPRRSRYWRIISPLKDSSSFKKTKNSNNSLPHRSWLSHCWLNLKSIRETKAKIWPSKQSSTKIVYSCSKLKNLSVPLNPWKRKKSSHRKSTRTWRKRTRNYQNKLKRWRLSYLKPRKPLRKIKIFWRNPLTFKLAWRTKSNSQARSNQNWRKSWSKWKTTSMN